MLTKMEFGRPGKKICGVSVLMRSVFSAFVKRPVFCVGMNKYVNNASISSEVVERKSAKEINYHQLRSRGSNPQVKFTIKHTTLMNLRKYSSNWENQNCHRGHQISVFHYYIGERTCPGNTLLV